MSLETLNRIISCESGWFRLARGGSYGQYVGLAQHVLSAWDDRFRSYAPDRWEMKNRWQNSRSMLTVTIRMMNAVGLSPWGCA